MSESTAAQAWTVKSSETPATFATNSVDLFFEDNFNAEQIPVDGNKKEFRKLDDSDQYLAVLERKLHKIKNDPSVLSQLAEKREQCMRELCLGSGVGGALTDSQVSLDRTVGLFDDDSKANDLVRRLRPEQPLSAGEIVPIVKHDVLQIRHEEEDESEVEELNGVSAKVTATQTTTTTSSSTAEENQDNVSR